MGFPGSSVVKNPPATARIAGSIPGTGRYPAEGNGNPLQYSCLGIPWTEEPGGLQSMGSQKNRTQFSDETTRHWYLTIPSRTDNPADGMNLSWPRQPGESQLQNGGEGSPEEPILPPYLGRWWGGGVSQGSVHSARAWVGEMSPRGHPFCDCSLPGAAQKRLPPTRMTPPYNHVALSQRCQGQEGEWGVGGASHCSHPNPGCNTWLQPPPVSHM